MDKTVLKDVTVLEVTVTQLLVDVIVNLEPRDTIVNRVSMPTVTQLLVKQEMLTQCLNPSQWLIVRSLRT